MFNQLLIFIALLALALIKPLGLCSLVIAFGIVPALALIWATVRFIRDTLRNRP